MWLKAIARLAPQTDRCRIPHRTPNRSGRQEPMVSRIYVEKKPGFDVEAQQLKGELSEILGIKGIEALRIINRYDVEGIDEELFRSCVPTVFSEPQVDVTYNELPASDGAVFAVEFCLASLTSAPTPPASACSSSARASAPPCAPPRSI